VDYDNEAEITSRITVRLTGDMVWPFEYFDPKYGRSKRCYCEPDTFVFLIMEAHFDELERTKNHMEPDWWNHW
jgi:hypothetical protein